MEFCFKWQKKSSRWEGKGDKRGIRGGKEKKKKNWGKKLKEKKGRNGKRGEKKKTMERGRIEPPSRIDLTQESNALDFYCDYYHSDL